MVAIFERLLIQKIDNFIRDFKESRYLFFDKSLQKLIHPGEYGIFREKICREFLKTVVPSKYSFGTGFVINSFDEVSTQCDIIIYDAQSTPLIQDDELQTFYPIESTISIGEIKSKVSKTVFVETLKKLSKIKQMRENIKNPVILYDYTKRPYDPKNYAYDQIFTFLICEKLDFNYEDILQEFDTIYDGISPVLRHNLILSLEDGLFCYYDGERSVMYPVMGNKICKNRLVVSGNNRYTPFKLFSSYVFLATSSTTVLYPEITNYMGTIKGGFNYTQDILKQEKKE